MTDLHTDEAAPRLFECVLDRSQTKMPDDYLPEAPGVLIAGEDMLRAAGYVQGSYRPRGWAQVKHQVFKVRSQDRERSLVVRRYGNFWVVERQQSSKGIPFFDTYALVCAFSLRPIWTHNCEAAMRLAEHCDPYH
jgi:hypothetical protein